MKGRLLAVVARRIRAAPWDAERPPATAVPTTASRRVSVWLQHPEVHLAREKKHPHPPLTCPQVILGQTFGDRKMRLFLSIYLLLLPSSSTVGEFQLKLGQAASSG